MRKLWSETGLKLVGRTLENWSGQPVGQPSFALQNEGDRPHYISFHVWPLSPSAQRLFCLFREAEPF